MSSLKDLASLIMVPSLVKDGRLDTVKPLGNSIIHPDATGNNDGTDGSTPAEGNFTFSRGSNLAATRVDVNGLIEKGRENLLTNSNQFDTSWNLTAASTITSGQEGYDGSNNAWLLNDSGQSPSYAVYKNFTTSGVKTLSIYAKAASTSELEIDFFDSSNRYLRVELSDGSIHDSQNLIDYNVESVGNGWYRCSLTANTTSTSYVRFGCNGAGSIYVQDSQVESSMVATDYIETGASTAQSGILEDLPRLDYSGGASCPALLLEPQRSNLITQSEYLSSLSKVSVGTASSPVTTANYALAPDGTMTATRVVFDLNGGTTSQDRSILRQSIPVGSDYFFSIYVKSTNGTEQKVIWHDGGEYETQTATSEWKRITYDGRSGIVFGGIALNTSTGADTSDILVWGFQVETGSYPTSYIPTMGSAVTRNHDVCKITGANATDIVNKPSMTLFAEWTTDTSNPNTKIMSIMRDNDGSYYSNFIAFTERGDLGAAIEVRSGGYLQAFLSSSPLTNGNHKAAVVMAENNVKLFVDGTLVSTATTAVIPNDLDEIYLAGYPDTTSRYGTKKSFLYFPTALTDSECIALTTI
jgi:hypothetical protein